MGALADHLAAVLPDRLNDGIAMEWQETLRLIKKNGLEAALMEREPSDELDAQIANAIVEKIAPEETAVLQEVVSGKRQLRFSKLARHLPRSGNGIPVLTTNYDRLVEVGCELAGLPIDTMFDGEIVGRADPSESRANHLRSGRLYGRHVRFRRRDHVRVFKPHGSLDWFDDGKQPLRYSGQLDLPRLLVSPGRRKLRKGYDRPFDEHREAMNRCLGECARLLIVGYGFNDDHLETHLSQAIARGNPTLILTHGLSPNAYELAVSNANVTAVDHAAEGICRIIRGGSALELEIPPIWDLGVFVDEVLRP